MCTPITERRILSSRAHIEAYDAADRTLTAARNALVKLAVHPRESGAGVTVTRFWKAGSVADAKIPALQRLDLSAWRRKSREEVRVGLVE